MALGAAYSVMYWYTLCPISVIERSRKYLLLLFVPGKVRLTGATGFPVKVVLLNPVSIHLF